MITGKGSIWKMLALLGLVLIACLDIIFATQSKVVMWINGLIVFGEIGLAVYYLYKIWDSKTLNDKAYKNK